MSTFADRQFLWDWAQLRAPGRKRYATRRAGLCALFALWGGINMAVRTPPSFSLLVWTLIAAAALAAIGFLGSQNAFDLNDKKFTALVQSGEPVPQTSPRKPSTMPRNAITIAITIAAIIPIVAPALLRLFLQ